LASQPSIQQAPIVRAGVRQQPGVSSNRLDAHPVLKLDMARIESGEYPKGSRIPTESEIVQTFEVARTTARRSIALLREQGLIDTVPQRASYVCLPADGLPLVTASDSLD
jgi:GntR family transcriptional regulator